MSSVKTSPKKYLQSCWEDEKRMSALYAPFRIREANPVDYDCKMKFWENAVLNFCLENNSCVFSLKRLHEEFKWKERIPLCLNTVIENLERVGQIKLKNDFLSMNPNETWSEWAVQCFVKTPVVWSFKKLRMALMESDQSEFEYVCISYLQKKGEEIVVRKECSNKNVYNLEDFQKMMMKSDGTEMNHETFDIMLLWLQLNKIIQVKNLENDMLIKFIDGKENNSLTDTDISIYMLEKNKLTIEKAIKSLEEEKEELMKTAKNYLNKGMRDTAKSYLRRKKAIEKTIEKRVNASENMEILLSRIQEVSSDSKVLETYKIGLNALKASFKENGLSEEDVTNTVTEIQEINEMHEEIQNTLSEPIDSTSNSELDEELKLILNNLNEEKDILFPEVPEHEPSINVKQNKLQLSA